MGQEERLPTVKEVRQRIDEMPTGKKNAKMYQNALRYLYLIAGRISEIVGDFEPTGKDAIKVKIRGDDAIIFAIQTARREGRYRPIALPLNPVFEPWTVILWDWFRAYEDTNPFGSLSGRAYQRMASEVFKGLRWPVEKYQKTVYEEVDKSKIKAERVREDGVRIYLVEYDNWERHWVEDPKIKTDTTIMKRHWRDFSLLSLRHQRIRELKYFYNFTDTEIRTFTGLTSIDRNNLFPYVLDRYNYVNPSNGTLQVESLKYAVESYYPKLLKYRE